MQYKRKLGVILLVLILVILFESFYFDAVHVPKFLRFKKGNNKDRVVDTSKVPDRLPPVDLGDDDIDDGYIDDDDDVPAPVKNDDVPADDVPAPVNNDNDVPAPVDEDEKCAGLVDDGEERKREVCLMFSEKFDCLSMATTVIDLDSEYGMTVFFPNVEECEHGLTMPDNVGFSDGKDDSECNLVIFINDFFVVSPLGQWIDDMDLTRNFIVTDYTEQNAIFLVNVADEFDDVYLSESYQSCFEFVERNIFLKKLDDKYQYFRYSILKTLFGDIEKPVHSIRTRCKDDIPEMGLDDQFPIISEDLIKTPVYGSCAIIGGSGILDGTGYGEEINKHDRVMRVNYNTKMDEYHTDIGSKFDFTILHNDNFAKTAPHLKNNVFSWYITVKRETDCENWEKKIDRKQIHLMGRKLEYSILDWSTVHITKNYRASTGLILAMPHLVLCSKISIYGFYPHKCLNHSPVPYHFYDNSGTTSAVKFHDMTAEFKFWSLLHNLNYITVNINPSTKLENINTSC